MIPPAGMVPSQAFEGFSDPAKNAAILLATFPAAAFDQLDKTMVPDALKKEGFTAAKREPITLPIGKGFLITGEQTAGQEHYRKWLLIAAAGDLTALVTVQAPTNDNTYSDKALRDALATLAVRASVPDAEQLSLLPFTVGNLAGFRVDSVLPGRALMLIDALPTAADTSAAAAKGPATDASKEPFHARMFVAAMPGGPQQAADADNFARILFEQIGGIKDVRVQDAEPLRIGGQAGYQTLARAKTPPDDTDVMVMQWLRFGTGGFLQMVGMGRSDGWTDMLTRLRAIRDSINSK